ncbi:HET-domain-containing protein [Patellaria atrata CBS 101060]|uniref:HET-domain-containing protein n=1 Tax=Patellaria atrata CBS 101060 TaxID=1346257 RepID=A0A9P4VM12_9PEZI|nr:HET-domain-containing protein [Patellaria atrata CBS 101060]
MDNIESSTLEVLVKDAATHNTPSRTIEQRPGGKVFPQSTAEFCEQCCQFDIRSVDSFMKSLGTPIKPSRVIRIGTIKQMLARPSCPLCRLISNSCLNGPLRHLFRPYPNGSDVGVSGAWFATLGPTEEQKMNSETLFISLWPDLYETNFDNAKIVVRPVALGKGDGVAHVPPSQTPFFARRLTGRFIDPELIKRWIDECEKNHTRCRNQYHRLRQREAFRFRAIDVQQYCLGAPLWPCRYVALSYVWGNASQVLLTDDILVNLQEPGSLKTIMNDLPKTVSDAIVIASKIGIRYLWIDTLCINRSQPGELRIAISNMDLIYRMACVTLIVADAVNANVGIAGVTEPRKTTEYMEEVDTHTHFALAALFDFKDYLKRTVYESRAWTYQESQLPARSLIFINGQVYFSCQQKVYSEELICEGFGENIVDYTSFETARKQRPVCGHESPDRIFLVDYLRAVMLYTSRQLTYQDDILNAFSGVLRLYCDQDHSRVLSGFPDRWMDIAILWQPVQGLERRPGFSSWSWAGWKGPVKWFNDGLVPANSMDVASRRAQMASIKDWLEYHTWIEWLIGPDENGLWTPAHTSSSQDRHIPSPLSERPVKPHGFEDALLHYTTSKVKHPSLLFRTVSAIYKIRPIFIGPVRYSSADKAELGIGLQLFVLLNRRDELCGWVMLDESWRAQAETEQEFLMLSEGKYYMDYQRPHHGHHYKEPPWDGPDWVEYYSMMVVRSGGVAERAGLGRVMKDAIPDARKDGAEWIDTLLL